MGAHDVARGDPPWAGGSVSTGLRHQTRSRVVLIAAASITWLFTVICLIGVIGDGDSDARLGFVILGVPFLAAALACTYAARTMGSREPVNLGDVVHVADGGGTSVPVAPPGELDLNNLPGGTGPLLEAMRRSYATLASTLADGERGSEAWQTMTQIEHSIVPTTVTTYRKVAGYDDADAEFVRAVRLLSRTFHDRRAVLTGDMLDELHTETHYIEDRFTPSELTVDKPTDEQQAGT